MSFGLMANLTPLATFGMVLPPIAGARQLNATEAGWVGGSYFADYATPVPVLATLAYRADGRWVFSGSSLIGAVASLAFGGHTYSRWTTLALRFLSGTALGGVRMPDLKFGSNAVRGRGECGPVHHRDLAVCPHGVDRQFRCCPRTGSSATTSADPSHDGAPFALCAFTDYTAVLIGLVAVGVVFDAFSGTGNTIELECCTCGIFPIDRTRLSGNG